MYQFAIIPFLHYSYHIKKKVEGKKIHFGSWNNMICSKIEQRKTSVAVTKVIVASGSMNFKRVVTFTLLLLFIYFAERVVKFTSLQSFT